MDRKELKRKFGNFHASSAISQRGAIFDEVYRTALSLMEEKSTLLSWVEKLQDELITLRAENEKLKELLDDPSHEKHCPCVPALRKRVELADYILKQWEGVEWKENDGQYDWIVRPDFDAEAPPKPPEEK